MPANAPAPAEEEEDLDVLEAVSILVEKGKRSRRVLGPDHPLTVEVHLQPSGGAATTAAEPMASPDRLDPLETVLAFWAERESAEPTDVERALLTAAVEAAEQGTS